MGGRGTLAGVRVAVTRPAASGDTLAGALTALGAEVLNCPLIRIEPPRDPEPLRRAARDVSAYDWLVFTSSNGVISFWDALKEQGVPPTALARVRIACVGPGTARAIEERGRSPDLVPAGDYRAEGLIAALASAVPLAGTRILLAQAEAARPVLREELGARGALVDAVVAYRSSPDPDGLEEIRRAIEAQRVDVVVLTASSAARSFAEHVGRDAGRVRVVAIGAVTAETAARSGLPVHAVATESTDAGLVDAVVRATESDGD